MHALLALVPLHSIPAKWLSGYAWTPPMMGSSLSLKEAYSILNKKILLIWSINFSFVLLIPWVWAFLLGLGTTHLIHPSYERASVIWRLSMKHTHPRQSWPSFSTLFSSGSAFPQSWSVFLPQTSFSLSRTSWNFCTKSRTQVLVVVWLNRIRLNPPGSKDFKFCLNFFKLRKLGCIFKAISRPAFVIPL